MIDVVIATYNRFEKALGLSNSLLFQSENLIENIFIVDSTENQNVRTDLGFKIHHILTNHKNQPAQRYIGYKQSKSLFILFLDDDMEIADEHALQKINNYFEQNDVIGLAINFKDKHQDTSLNAIATSAFTSNNSSTIKKGFNWFTAYPQLPDGVFGLCGVRGRQPQNGGITSFVSGGAFAAKREFLYQNFNFQLFDLYHQKVGKGEDAITGYTLSKKGEVHYFPELLFYHNDQKDSAYSIHQFAFSKRVTFSRIYLSQEKARLDKASKSFATIHFHWHTSWRVLGLVINYFLNKSNSRKEMMQGAIAGWKNAINYKFEYLENPML